MSAGLAYDRNQHTTVRRISSHTGRLYRILSPPAPTGAVSGAGWHMHFLLSEADKAIGALNIVATVLPNPDYAVSSLARHLVGAHAIPECLPESASTGILRSPSASQNKRQLRSLALLLLGGDRLIAANVGAYAIFKKCEDMGLIRQVNQGRRNRGLVSSDVDS